MSRSLTGGDAWPSASRAGRWSSSLASSAPSPGTSLKLSPHYRINFAVEQPGSVALWQQLLPHVLAAIVPDRDLDRVAEEVSWLLGRAALYRQTRGERRAALPLFQRAYAENRARLGDDHPTLCTPPTTSPPTCPR
jgi:hypothetical protein